jgi:hypothetical protein
MFWAIVNPTRLCNLKLVRALRFTVPFLLTTLAVFGTDRAGAATVFPTNAVWKYFTGQGEASSPDPASWRTVDFDDSPWITGPAPFYNGEPLTGTLISGMQNNFTCIFLRQKFVLTNSYEFGALTLAARCDDGYIAWINGVEVARYNMPAGFVPFDGLAILSVPEPVPYIATNILNPSSFLVAGTNVIAVQAFNYFIGSGDLQFNAVLTAFADTNAPTVAALPAGGCTRWTWRSVNRSRTWTRRTCA